jgi:hypothetical protein
MAEVTALVPIGDREVEMRAPSEGALVVMAKIVRVLPGSKIENVAEMSEEQRDKVVRNLGTLGQIVESMIVQDDDKDWLDVAMIDGDVSANDVFDAIRIAGEKINGANTPAGPAKAAKTVRRR